MVAGEPAVIAKTDIAPVIASEEWPANEAAAIGFAGGQADWNATIAGQAGCPFYLEALCGLFSRSYG